MATRFHRGTGQRALQPYVAHNLAPFPWAPECAHKRQRLHTYTQKFVGVQPFTTVF